MGRDTFHPPETTPMTAITATERARLDERGRRTLDQLEELRAALQADLAATPPSRRVELFYRDRAASLAGVERRIALLLRPAVRR